MRRGAPLKNTIAIVPEPDSKKPARKFKRTRLFFILWIVAFALGFGLTVRFSAQPSAALGHFVSNELSKLFSPKVSIREARLEPSTRSIILTDVRVGDDPEQPDLKIAKARIEVNFSFQRDDMVRVSRILLIEPELRAAAIGKLFKTSGDTPPPEHLPRVALVRGKLYVDVPGVSSMEFYDLSASVVARENYELSVEGSARTPLRGAVRVGGNINIKTGALDIRAETETAVDLQAITNEKLAPEIEHWRKECQPAGQLQFYARLSRESAAAPVVTSGEIEITGLRASAPNITIDDHTIALKEVVATDFKILGKLEPDGQIRLFGEGRVLGGAWMSVLGEARVDAASQKITDIRAGAQIRELILGPDVQKILDGIDDGVADAVRGLRPEGPVDLSLAVDWNSITNKPDIHAALDLSSKTRLRFLGFLNRDNSVDASFPYPIKDLSGRISVRPGKIIVAGVRGAMGTGTMAGAGTIVGSGIVGIDLRVRGAGLPMDEMLKSSMDGFIKDDPSLQNTLENDRQWNDPVTGKWKAIGLPGGPETLQLFDLQGNLDFNIEVKRPQGRRAAEVTVRAASDGNISGSFRDLPIRVDSLLGSVTFHGGLVQFGLDGRARGAKVRIEGTVDGRRDEQGKEPARNGLRLRVSGQDFPADPALAAYFDTSVPDAAGFIRDIEPTVKCSFEYRGQRQVNSITNALESFVSIQTHDGIVRRAPGVGVQMEALAASIKLVSRPREEGKTDLKVWMESVRSRYFGRPILATGIFNKSSDGGDPTIEFAACGIGLPLQNALLQQLLAKEAPRAAEAVAKYQFSGSFDAAIERRDNNLVNITEVGGTVYDATIVGPGVPGNFEHAFGPISLDPKGTLKSTKLRGKLNGSSVTVDNFSITPAAGEDPVVVSGTVSSPDPIDVFDLTRKAIPGASDWIDNMSLALSAIPKSITFELTVPHEGAPIFQARGSIQIIKGSIINKFLAEKMAGDGEIEQFVFDGKDFFMKGKVNDFSMYVAGVPMTGIHTNIELTQEGLWIRDFEADFVGGKLHAAKNGPPEILSVDFTKESAAWTLGFHLFEADLAEVFKYVPLKSSDIRGKMRLGATVSGNGSNFREYKGSGVVLVNDANLFEVPGFKPMPEALKLQERPAFKEMTGEFQILSSLVVFTKLILQSDSLELRGDGWVAFDGQLQMTFLPRQFINSIPLVGPVFTFIQDRIVDVTVFGTLQKPDYQINNFTTKRVAQGKELIAPVPAVDLGVRF